MEVYDPKVGLQWHGLQDLYMGPLGTAYCYISGFSQRRLFKVFLIQSVFVPLSTPGAKKIEKVGTLIGNKLLPEQRFFPCINFPYTYYSTIKLLSCHPPTGSYLC